MEVPSASLNRYLNEDVKNLPFAKMMRKLMENYATNNIDNVVSDSVKDDEGYIHMNKEVLDGSEPTNKGVNKDDDLYNMHLHYKDIMPKLEYLYKIGITLEMMLPKEALTFEENVQLLKEVIVKDTETLERSLTGIDDLSYNMVDHVVR